MSLILEFVGDSSSGRLEPRRVAELLHVPLESVAVLAKVHRNTLSRTPGSPQVQAGLAVIVKILVRVSEVMAGNASLGRAVLWFKSQPLGGFGSKTAMGLVLEGKPGAVLEHLAMLEDGTYARWFCRQASFSLPPECFQGRVPVAGDPAEMVAQAAQHDGSRLAWRAVEPPRYRRPVLVRTVHGSSASRDCLGRVPAGHRHADRTPCPYEVASRTLWT